MTMLSELNSDGRIRALVDAITERHGYAWRNNGSGYGGGITYSIRIDLSSGYESMLSEFPGNCSSIVLSNIQGLLPEMFRKVVIFSVDLCQEFKYGGLFISLTNQDLIDFAVRECGFKILTSDLFNPHSGSKNTFLLLDINAV